MHIIDCEQGSTEWKRARCGMQTASEFWLMREAERMKRGPTAGDWSGAQLDLMARLACERIAGEPLDEERVLTWQMRRGVRLEPAARREHENQLGELVQRMGFCTTDDRKFGCSLDGRIQPRGASEYKCLIGPGMLRKVLVDLDAGKFADQVQGGLWITGLDWCDFCVYAPFLESCGKQLLVKRVYRNDDFIAELEVDLLTFRAAVDEMELAFRNASSVKWFAAQQTARVIAKARAHAPADATLPPWDAPAPGLAVSPFERLKLRIQTSVSRAASDLIMDGAGDLLAADEYAELYKVHAQRWPEVRA